MTDTPKEKAPVKKLGWWTLDKAGGALVGGLVGGSTFVYEWLRYGWDAIKKAGTYWPYLLPIIPALFAFVVARWWGKKLRALRETNAALTKENDALKEEIGKLKHPVENVLKRLAFYFPYLILKPLGGEHWELGIKLLCSNHTSSNVNLGKMEIKLGKFGNKLDTQFSIDGRVSVPPAAGRLGTELTVYENYWSRSITRTEAEDLLKLMNEEGTINADIRFRIIDERAWWPDNSHLSDPDRGWTGQVMIVDHHMRLAEINDLRGEIEALDAILQNFLNEGGLDSPGKWEKAHYKQTAQKIHAIHRFLGLLPGMPDNRIKKLWKAQKNMTLEELDEQL